MMALLAARSLAMGSLHLALILLVLVGLLVLIVLRQRRVYRMVQ